MYPKTKLLPTVLPFSPSFVHNFPSFFAPPSLPPTLLPSLCLCLSFSFPLYFSHFFLSFFEECKKELGDRKEKEIGEEKGGKKKKEKEVTLGSRHFSLPPVLILLSFCSYFRLFISTDQDKERRKQWGGGWGSRKMKEENLM